MLAHGEGGHFVTTASMGGLLPGVNAGVYTSTKIAAVGLMEALRVELESTNIGTGRLLPRWRHHRQLRGHGCAESISQAAPGDDPGSDGRPHGRILNESS